MRLTITTDRLTLRPPERADAEALARGLADIEVARMLAMVPHPYVVEIAEGWIVFTGFGWRNRERFNFVIEERGRGVVGGVGLFHRGASPDWEISYWIARPAWGRGIASEALAAFIDWARDDLGADRVIAGHFEDNPASRRVLEKAGFTPTGDRTSMYCMSRDARVRCVGMARNLADAASAA